MPTTYRVVIETETRPREAEIALDHLPAIQVDAPNVDVPPSSPCRITSTAGRPHLPPGPHSGSS